MKLRTPFFAAFLFEKEPKSSSGIQLECWARKGKGGENSEEQEGRRRRDASNAKRNGTDNSTSRDIMEWSNLIVIRELKPQTVSSSNLPLHSTQNPPACQVPTPLVSKEPWDHWTAPQRAKRREFHVEGICLRAVGNEKRMRRKRGKDDASCRNEEV